MNIETRFPLLAVFASTIATCPAGPMSTGGEPVATIDASAVWGAGFSLGAPADVLFSPAAYTTSLGLRTAFGGTRLECTEGVARAFAIDLSGNGGENIAYICSTNDQQSLYMEHGGNWGGFMHSLEVPANSMVRFDMDLFIPPALFDDPEWMDQTVLYLKQNSKRTPSKELMLNITSVDGVPYVYATAKDYDMTFCETEYAYEWMHVSYVIDYLQGLVTEFTIDDNTFVTDELVTEDAGVPCTLFCLCGSYGANLTFDNVKVSVVPEPAALVALIALLALGIRRK